MTVLINLQKRPEGAAPDSYEFLQWLDLRLGDPEGYSNAIAGDVALNNVANFFDGPSVAQGSAGVWRASGSVQVYDSAGAAAMTAKLWDGTTVIASGTLSSIGANTRIRFELSGYIINPVGNIRISVKDATSANGVIEADLSGTGKDSTIYAVRIG